MLDRPGIIQRLKAAEALTGLLSGIVKDVVAHKFIPSLSCSVLVIFPQTSPEQHPSRLPFGSIARETLARHAQDYPFLARFLNQSVHLRVQREMGNLADTPAPL